MEFKPLSGREWPRFSGIKTFFRLPVVDLSEEFDVALVGVPYDGGVSYRPGCRLLPRKFGKALHWEEVFTGLAAWLSLID